MKARMISEGFIEFDLVGGMGFRQEEREHSTQGSQGRQSGIVQGTANCLNGSGHYSIETVDRDFPGGAVVKNPPASAGDTSLSPGPGRSHMPQSN